MKRILVTLATDTTSTHCGRCPHLVLVPGGNECVAFTAAGEPLERDDVDLIRSDGCHEAEMSSSNIERVLGRAVDDDEPPSTQPAPRGTADAEVRTAMESER